MEEDNLKEEERESKERLLEKLGVDPDELLDTVSKYMELYRKHVLLQFPLTADLKVDMKELFEKQYPAIKPYHQGWQVNWVFEAMEGVANMLSIRLVDFFEKVEKGEDYKEGWQNYEELIERYTKPYEAHKEVIDYDNTLLNAEQLRIFEQVLEENYQADVIGFAQMNRERNEFLNLAYMQTLRHFGELTEILTPDQWIHYDIIAGMGYYDYFDECRELNYYLIEKNMQEYPGMDYYQFLQKESEKLRDKFLQENKTVDSV